MKSQLLSDFPFLMRFILVGGGTGLLFLGLVYAQVEGIGMYPTLASTIACIIALCYNYLMHYHWTFASDAPHGKVFIRYCIMCAGAVVLNGLIMHFGLILTSIHFMFLQLLAGGAMTLWSLGMSFFWVFQGN
ncbi:MAG: GtrA family protein [Halioglobus sp.]|nr:GtrA family protein [Halioglobus sp.]